MSKIEKIEKPAPIILGGRTFPLRLLTLDELQDAIPALMEANTATKEGLAAFKKLAVIVLKDHCTEEEVGKLPMTVNEMFDAIGELAKVTGMRPLGERLMKMREEELLKLQEETSRRSTGTSSMPASVPTPDGTGRPSVN